MIPAPPNGLLIFLVFAIATLLAATAAFAALVFLLHNRNERIANRYTTLEQAWSEPLLDALGGMGEFDVQARVPQRERAHFLWFLVRLARRLRGTERETLQRLAQPYLAEVAKRVRDPAPEVRARTVQTLVTLGMPQYAGVVVGALDDSSPLVAMTAARGLAKREHSQFAPDVLARLDRFETWSRRFLAAMLSSIGEAASPELRATLADKRLPTQSRATAAEALAQLRDLQAGDIAARVLAEGGDRELLSATLGLLAVVGRSDHLPAIRKLIESGESWVRAQALETVARLGSRAEVPLLSGALRDPSPWVALRAAYGLREIGATDELVRLTTEEGQVGELAREVLSRSAP